MKHTILDDHLSEHFTLREMVASGTARKNDIDNIPDAQAVAHLRALCQNVLEPLRRRFGVIRITSGYRSPRLNDLLGGAERSQHLRGQAADVHCPSLAAARSMYDYIRLHLDYDQLLLEQRLTNGCCWLHVSYVCQALNRHDARFLHV